MGEIQKEEQKTQMFRYKDVLLPTEERVNDLLSHMTLREKVGQLNQRLYGFRAYERKGDEITMTKETIEEAKYFGGLGVVYGLYRADPWSAKTTENGLSKEYAIKGYNLLQRCCLEHSRLGIPLLLSSECPHGHQALDVARDPRWGRTEECFGEDPYLCSCFAKAAVEGTQSEGVAMVAKHFCAQGETTGGVNASAARIGERELREIHLPAAKVCCKAGVKGVMAAYNEIDGVYCHMNHHLLTEILRDEFGFDGIVMADGVALDRLQEAVGDEPHAAALALSAGVDVSLWDNVFPYLEDAVKGGLLDETLLDEAVKRVLTLKFEQGLFEHPYLPEDSKEENYTMEKYPQSLQLARESVVLLKNKNVLPLKTSDQKILVLGPSADDIYRMLGDYTPPVSDENSFTLLKGLEYLAGDRIIKTCSYTALTEEKKKEVQELIDWADVVILAVGGSSSRFGGALFDNNGAAVVQGTQKDSKDSDLVRKNKEAWAMDCGEGMDSSTLYLPGDQLDWFLFVRESKKPLISIVVAGRPYAISKIALKTDALLYSFYPGPYGGLALAQLLYGQESPSGRLPISIPAHVGQLPAYYNPKRSYEAMKYWDEEDHALYEFGEGFGYGQLSYENMTLQKEIDHGSFAYKVTFSVSNKSDADDFAVPQLYVRDIAASTVRRVRELKGFTKTSLKAGQTKQISIVLDKDAFTIWNLQMKQVVEPGEFEILLMDLGKIWDRQTITL